MTSNNAKLDILINKINKIDEKLNSIDNRLTSLENKVDSIDNRLTLLENNFNDFKKKVNKRLDGIEINLTQLINYNKKENEIIEEEIKRSIFKNLKNKNFSLFFIDVSNIFPKKMKNQSNQFVAQFDGLIIGTNDRNFSAKYEDSFELHNTHYKNNLSENMTPKIYNFYIVEAKHNTTSTKVIEKYEQYKRLKLYFKNIIDNYDGLNKKFKNMVDRFSLNYFNPDNIFLIIGGPKWEEGALDKFKQISREDNHIMKVDLSGNRYNFEL